MSNSERIAQVAHVKRAAMSESLICSFTHKKERFAQSFWTKIVFLAFRYVFCKFKKTTNSLIPSFLMSDVSKSLVFLSESLIRSLFAHFFAKNERFAQKSDEQIPNPDSA